MVLIRRDDNDLCTILDRYVTSSLEMTEKLEEIKREYEDLNYQAFFQDEATKSMLIVYKEGSPDFTVFMAYYKRVPARKNTFYYK